MEFFSDGIRSHVRRTKWWLCFCPTYVLAGFRCQEAMIACGIRREVKPFFRAHLLYLHVCRRIVSNDLALTGLYALAKCSLYCMVYRGREIRATSAQNGERKKSERWLCVIQQSDKRRKNPLFRHDKFSKAFFFHDQIQWGRSSILKEFTINEIDQNGFYDARDVEKDKSFE